MADKKTKYYAVRKGRSAGIYLTWDECAKQVIGCAGAVYKSFPTIEEAEAFMAIDIGEEVAPKEKKARAPKKKAEPTEATDGTDKLISYLEKAKEEYPQGTLPSEEAIAFVDGSYNQETAVYSFGCVFISQKGVETFSGSGSKEEFRTARNVAGELMGTLFAANTALERGIKKLSVYHDYTGISMWYQGLWKAESPVAVDYLTKMKALPATLEIKFVKVAGHTGVYLNEAADLIAKAAAGIE